MSAPRDEIVYPTGNNYGNNNVNSDNIYINTNRLRKQTHKLVHKMATQRVKNNLRIGAITKKNVSRKYQAYYNYYNERIHEQSNLNNLKRKEAERGREIQRKQQLKATIRHSIREAKRLKKETKNNTIKQLMNNYIKMTKHR